MKVMVGTFDPFYVGHERLLACLFEIAGPEGLCGDWSYE